MDVGKIGCFRPTLEIIALLISSLVGCSSLKPLMGPGFGNPYPVVEENKRLVNFQVADFEPFRGNGTGTITITGEAFLRTRGGDVNLGAGLDVFLYPVTEYTTEMLQREILGIERLAPMDERLSQFVRSTRADSRGQFEFTKLPPGDYYLLCLIQWEVHRITSGPVPTYTGGKFYLTPGYYSYMEATGGWAYARAKINERETMKVVVTR